MLPENVQDMQRGNGGWAKRWEDEADEGKGILKYLHPLSSSGLSSVLPILTFVSLPQAGNPQRLLSRNQISHLLSACCTGMSRAHYPAHYTPLLFPNINAVSPRLCLSLPPLFSNLSLSITLYVSASHPLPLHPDTEVHSWPLEGDWWDQLPISHHDWQLALCESVCMCVFVRVCLGTET